MPRGLDWWFPRFRNHTVAKAGADNSFHPQVGRANLERNQIAALFESFGEKLTTLVLCTLGRRGEFSTGTSARSALRKQDVPRSRSSVSTDTILRFAILRPGALPR